MPTSSWIITGPQHLDIDALARLRVQLVHGAVEITGRAEPGVHVEIVEVVGAPLEVTKEGDRVSVGYPSLGWDGWLKRLTSLRTPDRAVVRIAVGPGVEVTAATVAATITVRDVAEDVVAVSAAGATLAERTRGSVNAKTASGPVVVRDHVGPASVITVSGAVDLAGDLPRVTVTTVSGAVTLAPAAPSSVVSVTTVSSATAISLPAGTGIDLTVRAIAGSVRVDGVERRTASGPSTTTLAEPGAAGTSFVRIATVNGPVTVTLGGSAVPGGAAGEHGPTA
ncbi:MAG: hypothetical protein JJE50_07045 [Actinomycetales bacterium]|nr:hypothetical protein [Actinomycetales bacterium]